MTGGLPDITSQTQSVTKHPDGTEAQVMVVGPKLAPDFSKELRARARALLSVGVLPTAVDSIEDVPAGEIQRLTRIEGAPIRESRGKVMEGLLYSVIVNRD